jgi:hypothetical protein
MKDGEKVLAYKRQTEDNEMERKKKNLTPLMMTTWF